MLRGLADVTGRSGSPACGAGVGRRALVALELVTGAAGLAGGVLLAASPGGSLLRADPAVLAGTPFSDWRVPGVLLVGLVGGGFLLARWWRGHRYARELSMAAGEGWYASRAPSWHESGSSRSKRRSRLSA
jgi:hypothetical protein